MIPPDSATDAPIRLLLTFSPLDGNELTRDELEPYVGGLQPNLIEPMARYLDNGTSIFAAMGSQYEVINNSFMVPVGVASDGAYLWREWAGSYVRHYGIALPKEFVDHCRARDFQAPWLTDLDQLAVHDYMSSNLRKMASRKKDLWVDGPPSADLLVV